MNRAITLFVASAFAFSAACKHKAGGTSKSPDGSTCENCLQHASVGGAAEALTAGDGYFYSCQGTSGASDIMKTSFNDLVKTSLIHMPTGCYSLTTDGTSLYWINIQGSLVSMPVTGGTLSTLAANGYLGRSIMARDNTLYWLDSSTTNGRVMSMPVAGGTVTTLATGQHSPGHITADNTNLYWITDRSGPHDVMKVPRAGGTPTTLATENTVVTGVASDNMSVYWLTGAEGMHGSAVSVPVTGGTPVTIAQTGGPTAPQMGDNELLWGDEESQGVVRLPLNGGKASTVFADISASSTFLSDGAGNYFWDYVATDDSGYTNTDLYVLSL